MKKLKSFFHALKPTLDGLPDRLLMYALGLGNFLDALSKNDVGVDPPALDFRQRIEGVPQTAEQLHPLQELLGAWAHAGRRNIQSRPHNPENTVPCVGKAAAGKPFRSGYRPETPQPPRQKPR